MATKKDAIPMQEQEEQVTSTALIIKTDAHLGVIDDNFDILKVEIGKQMMKYQGLVFTDENIKEAKSTKAELNKMITTLEENRKAIKRKWNDPYNAFEAKVKEVVALIQGPLAEIDKQIVDFEERRKAEKRRAVEADIERQLLSVIGSNQTFIRQCGIAFDDRWLNAGMSMAQVSMDINNQISQMLRDITTIQSVCEGDEILSDLLIAYQDNKNLNATLQMRKDILAKREAVQRMQAEEEQRKKEAEARRQELEAKKLAINVASIPAQEQEHAVDNDESESEYEEADSEYEEPEFDNGTSVPVPPPASPTLYKVAFEVTMDVHQMQMLVKFFAEQGIPYKKLSHERIN